MSTSYKPLVAFLLIGFLSLSHPATGIAVEFAGPVSYPVGTSPKAVLVADFNGDGKPDIAVANSGSGNVSILMGNGDGTFKPAANFEAGMSGPASIAVSDFNNDGIRDLAVWAVPGALSVLLGNGDGSFRAPKVTALPATLDLAALDLAIADFNLDHRPDLAVLVHDSNGGDSSRIFILSGNGDGTFQTPQQSSDVLSTVNDSNVKYLVTADFNGDARPDLAVQVSGGVQVLLGQGNGSFQFGPSLAFSLGEPKGFRVSDLKVSDINGDGNSDLLLHLFYSTTSTLKGLHITDHHQQISLFLGHGDGSFQPEEMVDSAVSTTCSVFGCRYTGSGIGAPVVGDCNGDGKPDLAYIGPGVPGIRLARGDHLFSSPILFDPNGPSDATLDGTSYIAKDLNGDKLSDLIFMDVVLNAVVIDLNTGSASGADLSIVATTVDPASIDGAFAYKATIMNEGPEDATEVTFSDTLPSGVSFVAATATQGSCNQSGGIVTCAIGALPSAFDAQVTVAVRLKPTATGAAISNSMNVTATEPDLALANNTAAQDTAVFTLTVSTAGPGSGTVASSPAGIDCGAVCSEGYMDGSAVSLIPAAAPGSVFSGWSGACTGTDPNGCTVGMSMDQTVTATFVTAPTGGPGAGGTSGGGGGASDLLSLLVMAGLLALRARAIDSAVQGGRRPERAH